MTGHPYVTREVITVLVEFKDSLTLNVSHVDQTHLAQHEIDTGDARTITMCPGRLPLARPGVVGDAAGGPHRALR